MNHENCSYTNNSFYMHCNTEEDLKHNCIFIRIKSYIKFLIPDVAEVLPTVYTIENRPISAYMHISKFIPCILTFEFPRIIKLFPTKTFTLPHPILDSFYITRVSPFKQTWLYSISKDAFTQVTDCLANWFWGVDF